jgi:ribosome-associated protein
MEGDLVVNQRLTVPRSEVQLRFSRSGGPGGQNVNRVETRVELLFDVDHSPSLKDEDRVRIRQAAGAHVGADGLLRVVVSDTRSQLENRRLADERFVALLRRALRQRATRWASRPPPGAVARRLDAKRHQAKVKAGRQSPEPDGDDAS